MMDSEENLLDETVETIRRCGHAPDDVRFVMSNDDIWGRGDSSWCTWDEFALLADFTYDAGFGGENIRLSLTIVGDDWWLERHEYDGSEWWEHKTLPIRPDTHTADLPVRT